jgi:hypothetical protein
MFLVSFECLTTSCLISVTKLFKTSHMFSVTLCVVVAGREEHSNIRREVALHAPHSPEVATSRVGVTGWVARPLLDRTQSLPLGRERSCQDTVSPAGWYTQFYYWCTSSEYKFVMHLTWVFNIMTLWTTNSSSLI